MNKYHLLGLTSITCSLLTPVFAFQNPVISIALIAAAFVLIAVMFIARRADHEDAQFTRTLSGKPKIENQVSVYSNELGGYSEIIEAELIESASES